ncbi:hypothetical protein TrRE_jg10918, partial [Triparma retinervis]
LTTFAVLNLKESVGWGEDWWAFLQPPLGVGIWAYYVAQMAFNLEAALYMVEGVVKGGGEGGGKKDVAMMIHHAATLFVLMAAWRFGFARVGVAVLVIHDASDIPIDAMRICQMVDAEVGLYASVAAVLTSWAALRIYAFPTYIILSALRESKDMWTIFGEGGVGVPDWGIGLGYVVELTPLVVLWGLSCYWYMVIWGKVLEEVGVMGNGGKGKKGKKRD